MSFLENIPRHIAQLETEERLLYQKRAEINWGDDGHYCDCEYCDRQGEGGTDGDPDAQEKADRIGAQLRDVHEFIDKLSGKKPSLINPLTPNT